MKIDLRLYASLRKYLPEKSGEASSVLEVRDGTTIRGLLTQLGVPLAAPRVIFLNGIHAEGDEILKDGDRVGAFPPVAGG